MARRPKKMTPEEKLAREEFVAADPKGTAPRPRRRRVPAPAAIPAAPTLEQYGQGLIKVLEASDCQHTLGDRLLSQYQGECALCGETVRMSVHVLDNTRAFNRYSLQCECGQYVSVEHHVVRPKS